MDATVQLALMTKAALVFGRPGTFLSFPVLSPLAQSAAFFDALGGLPGTPEALAAQAEFSRITGVLPSGPIAPDGGDDLYDVYAEALETARLASSSLSDAEQLEFDAARAFLYRPAFPGSSQRVPGPVLIAYQAARDAHFTAQEAYSAARLSAEQSGDAGVLERWRDVDEPRLRALVADSERAWEAEGHRAAVDAARQAEAALGAKAPSRLWEELKAACEDTLDRITGPFGEQFAPASIFPANLADADWPEFVLSGDELGQLVAQADPALRDALDAGGASDVTELRFEFRSVGVERSWLQSRAFRARCWRLGDEGGELSDGGTPPAGRLPSYVAGLVLARHVRVTRASAPPGPVLPGRFLRDFLVFDHVPAKLHQRGFVVATPPESAAAGAVAATSAAGAAMSALSGPVAAASAPSVPAVSAGLRRTVIRDHRTARRRRLTGSWAGGVAGAVLTPAIGGPLVLPPPTPDPPATTHDDDPDGIIVLAFICRPTPRCPDPDLTLDWRDDRPEIP